ncbi:MAG: nucleotidyltransferase domain-containing protein [Firmicutes bacterium]|nr:nucleotidyltransferase domain-containing protein [Bacillota bacterium]
MIDANIIDIILLARNYPAIKRVGIFGSFVRGDGNDNSDMDLLYDYDSRQEAGADELLNYIEEVNDLLISYTHVPKIDYVWYKGVLNSQNQHFRASVLNDVQWVYEK